ncbi:MAG: type I secretion system permease/ATPase [Thiobacillaceae bacterium]|jgi:PrtD family type I secretion system ABC transporter|nr:type I secretion system permease/ATPase [Thiobacillaceae bacterium]
MAEFLRACRRHFLHTGLFSLFVNVLILAVPLYTLEVFDRVFSSRSLETLLMLSIAATLALLAMMGLDLVRGRLLQAAGATLDRGLGPEVIRGVFAAAARGAAAPQGMRDVATLRNFLAGPGVVALFDAPWAPLFTLLIFFFHPLLGLFAAGGSILLFLLAWLNERLTRAPQETMQEQARDAARFIDASVRNAEAAKALGMGDALARRWSERNDLVLATQSDLSRRAGWLTGLTRFTRLYIQVVMIGVGAYLVVLQELSTGAMMACTLVLARALGPVEAAINTWKGFIDARAAHARLDQLLRAHPRRVSTLDLPSPRGALVVQNLGFVLPGGERPILQGIGFGLEAGQSLGLIGPSAAGKSTLARVLTGIWPPSAGTVRLDGASLADYPPDVLAAGLGYLPQDVELFPGTVAENIARMGTAYDHEAVVAAARRANAHDMILRLPRGYDTQVGENGANLSAGQRQRVGLARALFGEPRLVVLDEPNANLDSEGEEALVRTMAQLTRDGVTLIVISHRPSLLAAVDRLLVLRDGRVELFGPRDEVMARVTGAARTAAGPLPIPRKSGHG